MFGAPQELTEFRFCSVNSKRFIYWLYTGQTG